MRTQCAFRHAHVYQSTRLHKLLALNQAILIPTIVAINLNDTLSNGCAICFNPIATSDLCREFELNLIVGTILHTQRFLIVSAAQLCIATVKSINDCVLVALRTHMLGRRHQINSMLSR